MNKYHTYLLAAVAVLLCLATNAQGLNEKERAFIGEHNIQLVDSTVLFRDLMKDNGKVKMVVIFTNYCPGTPLMFENIKKFNEQYADRIEYILCSSAGSHELRTLAKVPEANGYTGRVYFIDPEHYREYRDDERKKGLLFRNAICGPCRNEVIGTPYYLFFDTHSNILFHGYSTRNDFNALLGEYFKQQ
ncbi:MAG: hypothetical protein H6550_02865 [Chitinophagales bacterium]|nr:hypothetical protein [Chitinophagales bacterium]